MGIAVLLCLLAPVSGENLQLISDEDGWFLFYARYKMKETEFPYDTLSFNESETTPTIVDVLMNILSPAWVSRGRKADFLLLRKI